MSIHASPSMSSPPAGRAPAPWRGRLAAAALRLAWLAALSAAAAWLWQPGAAPWQAQHRVAEIQLALQPGQDAVLGRHHLAAPAADSSHLRVWRDAQGAWWLSNVSAQRAVAWAQGDEEGQLRQQTLQAGQTLWVAGSGWQVLATTPAVHLAPQAAPERVWRFDGHQLVGPEDAPVGAPACADSPLAARLRQAWNQHAPAALAWPTPLAWGGTQRCGTRLPLAAMPLGGLSIVEEAQGYRLQATAAAAQRVCLSAPVDGACPRGAALFEQALPLTEGLRLTVGRTTLLTRLQDDGLHWLPLRRGGWVTPQATAPAMLVEGPQAPPADSAHALRWRTEALLPWQLPAALVAPWVPALVLLLVALGAAALHLGWRQAQGAALMFSASLGLAAGSALLWLLGSQVGPAVSLAWAGLALAGVAWLPGRTGWVWLSHALLATMLLVGLALQWQLGLQATDTGGWQYLQKTAALGALGLHALQGLAWWQAGRPATDTPRRTPRAMAWEVALLGLGLAALAGLGLQVLWGSEEGVFGVQPLELAKLALVVLGAHALAVRLEWQGRGGWRHLALWWRMLVPVALFTALAAVALLLLQDYSPLLLVGLWLLGLLAAWATGAGSWWALALATAAAAMAAAGWYWLHEADGATWMAAHGFYGERFAVWLQPQTHPHSGEQVLRALRLAAQGGWWGDAQAAAWRVPAVQDDMAPAFLAGRFGLATVLALWAVQVAYLASLGLLGWQALCQVRPGDALRRWQLRLVFFSAWGAAALFAGHLLLSWGTNTGWLPVMGQPMPLVSAGGSVIVLLLAPLHLLWQGLAGASAHPRQEH